MIFDNHGELILVGDLWTAESGRAFLSDVGRQLVWSRAH
jgi:hypothetical protein